MKLITETTLWIASFLYIAAPTETARILAIIAVPSRKGHEVVVLTSDPINDPSLTNLTEINFNSNYKSIQKYNFFKMIITESYTWLDVMRYGIWSLSRELAENIYEHPQVRKMYAPDSDEKFDVVIVETITVPSLYALAYRFNAPLIGVSTFGLFNTDYYLLGAPVMPSHPSAWEMEDKAGFNLSLWRRIKNFVIQWYYIYEELNHFYPEQQAIAEKYLGKDIPDISDMERNISIIFQNQQEALSFVRSKPSNVLAFGNFHISKKPAALPKNLKDFLANSSCGFIYMSLGTNVRMSAFPESAQSVFQDVFASLPYKVLWKHEMELPNKPDNVYVANWFPQQSILAHPNIKLFIYQGGLQSTEEAVYYTVPLLGLPVLADQYTQVNKMVSLGVAKCLSNRHISRESLNASILDILNDGRYKKRMLELKVLNEDKPYNLLEHVIWWIEFVIRHKGAPHLHDRVAHHSWYQKYEMDVIAILSITIFITLLCILVIIYKLLKIILTPMRVSVIFKEKTN
ncbi:hypothetical protein PUN28_003991 [Cardiocondyla obscurior]|uniref:Uncharacterized protein n=1 Tax=Cardiocondyla obscurior TaxID=286306 RepID=A0AAW2GPA8_9HYME